MTILRTLIKPSLFHQITRQTSTCFCQFSPLQSQSLFISNSTTSTTTSFLQSRNYASKKKGKGSKSSSSSAKEEDEDSLNENEQDYAPVKGKGVKKGKGSGFNDDASSSSSGSGNLGEGIFDLKLMERGMDDAIEKLRVGLRVVVGRVGKVSADLLDGIKVEVEGKRSPLSEFASVSVKDGKDLLITVYEEASVPDVSKALYASSLNLTPQVLSPTTLKVPVPRADWDKRQELVKKASEVCEGARVLIRSVRGKGMKDIKNDVEGKIIGKEDSRSEVKKLDSSTKKRTDEVDSIFEKAKKVLMDE